MQRYRGLDLRKREILKVAIRDYIKTATPVASAKLVRMYSLDVCPATVRNDLSSLEQQGYLKRVRFSAGRIPTELGYHFYAGATMNENSLNQKELEILNGLFSNPIDLEWLLKETPHYLTQLTGYPSFVYAPGITFNYLRHLDLFLISSHSFMVVFVFNTGQIIKKTIQFDFPIDHHFLEIISRVFQNYPRRLRVNELSKLAENEDLPRKVRLGIKSIADEAIKCLLRDKFFISGLSSLSIHPEFLDVVRFVKLLKAVEDGAITRFLAENYFNFSGLVIRIGLENPLQFADCSFITTSFSVEKEPFGVVGLLGPIRMDYPRATSVVRLASRKLSEALSVWFN